MSNVARESTIKIDPETLANYLRAAADQFDADAAKSISQPRIREHFVSQANEARVWAEALENAFEIIGSVHGMIVRG